MRVIKIPPVVSGIVFDIDKTLYTNDTYAESQISVLIERLARERGEDLPATKRVIDELQIKWGMRNNGARQSLGNLFATLGITIQTSVAWREELIRPEEYLEPDERLQATLKRLASSRGLIAVTNNPRSIGERTLTVLGVIDVFADVIGLDTTMRSKPHPGAFALAAERLSLGAETMISVGDRFDVDLAPALEIGMGAVLVSGVEDVYDLPGVIDD